MRSGSCSKLEEVGAASSQAHRRAEEITQKQKNLFGSIGAVNMTNKTVLDTEKSVGVSDLLGPLGTWARGAASSLTVVVIGMPNVGKSSLINSLKRSKPCNAASFDSSNEA